MRATLNQLEAFYWIARLGGFHAAATRLNLTQPTVSLRIRGLEEALGLLEQLLAGLVAVQHGYGRCGHGFRSYWAARRRNHGFRPPSGTIDTA